MAPLLAFIGGVAVIGYLMRRFGQDSRPGFDERQDTRFGALR